MEMNPKRKATLEKQISRAGGVRQYVDLLGEVTEVTAEADCSERNEPAADNAKRC